MHTPDTAQPSVTARPAVTSLATDWPVAGQVKSSLHTTFDGLDHFREEWDEAVSRLGGSIYMTYDWLKTWWNFYGHRRELRLLVFRVNDDIVGLIPLYLDRLGIWPLRLKVARLVGANIPPKVFNPPIHEAWAKDIFRSALQVLFGKEAVDVLSYGPVSELHEPSVALPRACSGLSGRVTHTTDLGEVHSVFSLPASLEDYFDGLSRSERKKRRHELQILQKECHTKVDVVSDPARLAEEFERFAEQHTAQWQSAGKLGHFGAWPKGKEYNAALVQAQGARGRVRFVRIVTDSRVISSQYVFAFGDTYFAELPSRAIGPGWERLSLGAAGMIRTIESAIQEGKQRLEAGLGHYEYKLKMGAREHTVRTVRVVANQPASWIRRSLFNILRLGLRYGYHRIWYSRIMPRLPKCFRSSQWNLWLRYDF